MGRCSWLVLLSNGVSAPLVASCRLEFPLCIDVRTAMWLVPSLRGDSLRVVSSVVVRPSGP